MKDRIDCSGLSCPLPVVKTKNKIKSMPEGEDELEVIVDTGTARDNIARMTKGLGWETESREEGDGFLLTIRRK